MAATVAELVATLTVDTSDAQAALNGIVRSFAGVNSAITTLTPLLSASTIGFAGVAGAVVALGKAAFDAAVAFDEASDKIRISTGAVGEDLTKLEGSFKTVFTSIPTSAQAASEAIGFLSARLGVSGKELEDLATTELELSRITGSALTPQLEATTRVFKDWEVATGSQTEALDFLFKVGQKTATGVTDLSQRLVQFGAPLRQLGFSFQDAAVLIGKFQAEGVELSKALPGLRLALSKMAKEGVNDAAAAFQLLIEKIQAAKTPMEATRQAIEVFGQRAGPDMAEAIKQGRFSIEELKAAVEGSRETIVGAAADTNDFAEKWIILKNKASEALEPLGKIVFDALGLVIGAFTDTEAQMQAQWDKFWNELSEAAVNGVNHLADAIMNADQSPFFRAGERAGQAIRDGFDNALKGLLGISGPVIEATTKPWLDSFKSMHSESEKTWKGLVSHAAAAAPVVSSHLKSVGSAAKAMGKDMSDQAVFLRQLADAMGHIADSITKKLNDIEIGKILKDKISATVTELNTKLNELSQTIDTKTVLSLREMGAAALYGDGSFEALINRMLDMKAASEVAAAAAKRIDTEFKALSDHFQDLSHSIPDGWNTIIDAILTSSGRLGDDLLNLGVKVKGVFSDIFQVVGNLPGKIGDALRKGANEFERWVKTIDGILGLLNRVFSAVPANLGDLIGKVISIFKSTTVAVQASTAGIGAAAGAASAATAAMAATTEAATSAASSSWDEMAGRATASASTVETAAHKAGDAVDSMNKQTATGTQGALASISKYVAGVTGAIAGLSMVAGVFGSGMGRVKGGLQGALGGLTAGASIGFMFGGPVGAGIGAIIGGVGGLIAGIFGGGKTALQKAQEAAQLQQAKDAVKLSQQQVLKAVEDVKQSMVKTLDDARALLESIQFYSQVPDISFDAFFADVGKLFDRMLDEANKLAGKVSDDTRAAAEALKPVVELFSMIPAVLDSINAHLKVPNVQFKRFFADAMGLIERMGAVFDAIPEELVARARKFQEKLGDALKIIPDLGTALSAIADVSSLPHSKFDAFQAGLNKLVKRLGDIAETMDKGMLKAIAFFAEQTGAAIALLKDAIDLIRALVDLPMPSEDDFDNLFVGLQKGLDGAIRVAVETVSLNLPMAAAFWEKAQVIVGVLKEGIDFIKALVGTPMPSADEFTNLFSGLQQGLTGAIQVAVDTVSDNLPLAVKFWNQAQAVLDALKQGAEFLKGIVGIVMPTEADFGNLFTGLSNGLNRAITAAQTISDASLTVALDVWERTKDIFDVIKNAVSTVKEIADAQWPDDAAWAVFGEGLDRALNALQSGLDKVLAGQSLAERMATAAAALADSVSSAASSLASAAGVSIGSPGGGGIIGGGGDVGGGGGFGGGDGRLLSAQRISPVTVNVTVHGALIHQTKLQDVIVDAITQAQRRGRLVTA